ncbi:hypothetical protein FJSC11DRAFT_0180 [Fischerella thermalis JSC-11]|jgi:hypothetical protein|uniref:Uncharacterized protein n=1 Tax=Fischerella thermalis JSC-11 TaxID=741277 RepID=G6FMT3_9CYAN|nr:hypothetical protein FJSC11DRAFT_0180 [Fischerella thermalis JSC-11]
MQLREKFAINFNPQINLEACTIKEVSIIPPPHTRTVLLLEKDVKTDLAIDPLLFKMTI